MFRLTTFCCGCNLRAGAITAFILDLIGIGVVIVLAAVCFAAAPGAEKDDPKFALGLRIFGGIYLFAAVVGIIVAACMFVAIRQHRAGLVLPWLVLGMIHIVLNGVNLTLGLLTGAWINGVGLISHGFFIYLWIVVMSYYLELQDNSAINTDNGKV